LKNRRLGEGNSNLGREKSPELKKSARSLEKKGPVPSGEAGGKGQAKRPGKKDPMIAREHSS